MNAVKIFKTVRLIFLAGILLTIGVALILNFFSKYTTDEISVIVFTAFYILFCPLYVSYLMANYENKLLKRISKVSLIVYPVMSLIIIIVLVNMEFSWYSMLGIISILFLSVVPLAWFFVYAPVTSLKGTIIIIAIFSVAVFMKSNHIPLAGIFLTLSLTFGAIAFYSYGIRCLFIPEKANYLKTIAVLCGTTVALSFLGLLFKTQHWPLGSFLLDSGQYSLIIGTLIVLFTLPSAGYADWKPDHKRILLRLLLPWILIFLLFVLRFLLPDVHKVVWGSNSVRVYDPFGMSEYQVPPAK
jgi:hypothetical protein